MTDPSAGPPPGHPDTDALSDLDSGLLEGTQRETELQAHVAGCVRCADVVALLAETRAGLRELPDEPMPADVIDRIDAALATAAKHHRPVRAPATITALSGRQRARSRRWARAAPAVAAGVVLLMAGAVGLGALRAAYDGPRQSAARQADSGAPGGAESRTGQPGAVRDYDTATLAAGVRLLLSPAASGARPQAVPQAARSASPRPTSGAPSGDQSIDPELRRLQDPRHLSVCVAELSGRTDVRPLAVDYARFEGQPAVIIVLPHPNPAYVQAWVVGPECSTGQPDLRRYELVARAG